MVHAVADSRLGDFDFIENMYFPCQRVFLPPAHWVKPRICSQELLVLDIQFHNREEQEFRATVGKGPAAPEPAAGFSAGQQCTKPRAG